jgi:hypothetical protein
MHRDVELVTLFFTPTHIVWHGLRNTGLITGYIEP